MPVYSLPESIDNQPDVNDGVMMNIGGRQIAVSRANFLPWAVAQRASGRVTLAFLGHSFVADGVMDSGGQRHYYNYGMQHWVRSLTSQRAYTDPSLTFGGPGLTLGQVITQYMGQALAAKPDYLILEALTNSLTNGETFASITTQFNTLLTAFGALGTTVIVPLIIPRSGGAALTAGDERTRNRLNAWLMLQQQRTDCRVLIANVCLPVTDFSTGAVPASYQRTGADGLHLGVDGMRRYAQAIADLINGDITRLVPMAFLDADDTFDASLNPSGNGLANGLMAGSAAATGGATGNGPTTWTNRTRNAANSGNAATLTAAFSKVADSRNPTLPLTQIVLGGTSTAGDKAQMEQVGSGYNIGDQVVAGCYYEIDANAVGLASVHIQLVTFTPGFLIVSDGTPASIAGTIAGNPLIQGWLETPPMTFAGNGQAWTLDIQANASQDAAVATTATVRVGQAYTRKIN